MTWSSYDRGWFRHGIVHQHSVVDNQWQTKLEACVQADDHFEQRLRHLQDHFSTPFNNQLFSHSPTFPGSKQYKF